MAAIARTRGRARIKGDTWRRMRKSWPWYLFILPNVVGFLAFGIIPLVAVLVFSFYHWYLFTSPNYIGIEIGGTKLQLGVGPGNGMLRALCRSDVNAMAEPSRSFCDPFCKLASNN